MDKDKEKIDPLPTNFSDWDKNPIYIIRRVGTLLTSLIILAVIVAGAVVISKISKKPPASGEISFPTPSPTQASASAQIDLEIVKTTPTPSPSPTQKPYRTSSEQVDFQKEASSIFIDPKYAPIVTLATKASNENTSWEAYLDYKNAFDLMVNAYYDNKNPSVYKAMIDLRNLAKGFSEYKDSDMQLP